jgi:hypothetical protein
VAVTIFSHLWTSVLQTHSCVSSGFRRRVYEVFALLACNKALVGSYLPTFRDSLSDEDVGEDCLTHGVGTSRLSRNVGN